MTFFPARKMWFFPGRKNRKIRKIVTFLDRSRAQKSARFPLFRGRSLFRAKKWLRSLGRNESIATSESPSSWLGSGSRDITSCTADGLRSSATRPIEFTHFQWEKWPQRAHFLNGKMGKTPKRHQFSGNNALLPKIGPMKMGPIW